MVQPLPPPRNYRAKTRLARCRARQEAIKKSKQNSTSKKGTWIPFDSAPGLSSSWSGEGDENQESVEVAMTDALPSSPPQKWVSEPIHDNMSKLPVIPLPPPSSMSQPRNLPNFSVPPLQQRDTNANAISSDVSYGSGNDEKSQRLKLVSRPIESSRDRGRGVSTSHTRRSRSRSRTSRGRSASIVNKNRLERSISDSSTSHGSKETGPNETRDASGVAPRQRSRSLNRRERSLSIIRARRNSKNITTARSRSLSVAASRSTSTAIAQNIIRENRSSVLPSSESRSSRESTNIMGPPSHQSIHRGNSVDHQRLQNSDNNYVLRRGQSVDPQPGQDNHNNTASITTTNNCGVVSLPSPIHTRTLLTSSVYNNEATGIWITTINMNQKLNVTRNNAAKYLKAFSFQTEREARESAYANAPAQLLPFNEHPRCFSCDAKFGVLRRPSHCKNCGVVVCNSCVVNWSKQSIPETYNIKNENVVKVCKCCDSLSKMFRQSLVEADYDTALTIYNTGNINLRCQFMAMKGSEAMLPIHCAAEGGSLKLLQWLVDIHHCPIKRIRTSNKNRNQTTNELITTSKGRNVLAIAMESKSVEIMNYLVHAKKTSFVGIRSIDVALNALEAVLLAYPQRNDTDDEEDQSEFGSPATYLTRSPATTPMTPIDRERHTPIRNGIPIYEINSYDSDDESTGTSSQSVNNDLDSDDEQSVATTVHDACILCYEKTIDCVATPCGHQICCLGCSKNLTNCPVCNVPCKFIKIFKP